MLPTWLGVGCQLIMPADEIVMPAGALTQTVRQGIAVGITGMHKVQVIPAKLRYGRRIETSNNGRLVRCIRGHV